MKYESCITELIFFLIVTAKIYVKKKRRGEKRDKSRQTLGFGI